MTVNWQKNTTSMDRLKCTSFSSMLIAFVLSACSRRHLVWWGRTGANSWEHVRSVCEWVSMCVFVLQYEEASPPYRVSNSQSNRLDRDRPSSSSFSCSLQNWTTALNRSAIRHSFWDIRWTTLWNWETRNESNNGDIYRMYQCNFFPKKNSQYITIAEIVSKKQWQVKSHPFCKVYYEQEYQPTILWSRKPSYKNVIKLLKTFNDILDISNNINNKVRKREWLCNRAGLKLPLKTHFSNKGELQKIQKLPIYVGNVIEIFLYFQPQYIWIVPLLGQQKNK